MPHGYQTFAIDFDFVDHHLTITTSGGDVERFPLEGLSVARFYAQLFGRLAALGIEVAIAPRPYELADREPFPTDTAHAAYDREYVGRFWRILTEIDAVLQEFSGRFSGKSSPVHLFWHSFDLALTRFSGRRAPDMPGVDRVTREAYSHEVISFGFWAGDARLRAPAFYSYTAPQPPGLTDQPLRPASAFWNTTARGTLALLMYDDLRREASPKTALLDFFESAYQGGANTADWDQDALRAAIAELGAARGRPDQTG